MWSARTARRAWLFVAGALGGAVSAGIWAVPAPGLTQPSGVVTTVTRFAASPDPADRVGPVIAAARPSPVPEPLHRLVDRRQFGQPWGSATGLLMFRGNPTRTWYGAGPVPAAPEVRWRFPEAPMCSLSSVGNETRQWCGSGWTGQPAVWEHDGVTEVVFGAYDGAVHFVDAQTGRRRRPDFVTADLIKGSVSIDPDGYPLLYTGSRDNRLRVIALDRPEPTELWSLTASPEGLWNDDWDGNPVIVDGLLIEGGEDGFLYVIELGRGTDAEGLVTVAPRVLAQIPTWTPELLAQVGDRNVSVEGSVAVFEGRAYVANSAGRVLGVDLEAVRQGREPVVFDYWLGDDTDASLVVDAEGMVYAAVELERNLPRAAEVGQLVKLDPARPAGDALVWSLAVPAAPGTDGKGGLWATPALHEGVLYATTHAGELLAVDAATGTVRWRQDLGFHEWASPVVVDDTLLVATCERAGLSAWDVGDPGPPLARWSLDLPSGGCIESTPAVWDGGIYVGSRDGYLYAFADDGPLGRVAR